MVLIDETWTKNQHWNRAGMGAARPADKARVAHMVMADP